MSSLADAAQRFSASGFEIIWDGVEEGRPYDPATPPSDASQGAGPDGIVVEGTESRNQWPGRSVE